MDGVELESKSTTVTVSELAEKLVRDKPSHDAAIRLGWLRTTVLEDKIHAELNVDLELTRKEPDRLLKNVGL